MAGHDQECVLQISCFLSNFLWNICCFGFPANTINLKCVTYNLRKSNLSRTRLRKSLQARELFARSVPHHLGKEVFPLHRIYWKYLEKTFSMKFPKNMQSYERNDTNSWTILFDFSDNYQWWFKKNMCLAKIQFKPICHISLNFLGTA